MVIAMSTCQNSECACHEVEAATSVAHLRLSTRDLDAKYRSALTKLENARDELEHLSTAGYFEATAAIDDLCAVINAVKRSLAEVAEKHGFTPKRGIGVGDWKGQSQS